LSDAQQFSRIREVPAFFEECLAESEAHGFAAMQVGPVRAGCEREGRQGGHREQVRVEPSEEVRGHGLAKIIHLFHQECSRQSFAVDEFKWPSANSDRNIFAAPLLSKCEETPKADVSERTSDVRKDLDELRGFDALHESLSDGA
jgi:hypothetical protein